MTILWLIILGFVSIFENQEVSFNHLNGWAVALVACLYIDLMAGKSKS